jgi:predicted transcriptional regulator
VDFVHDLQIKEGSKQCRASFKKYVCKAATAQFCEYCTGRDVSGGVNGEHVGAQIPQLLTCALAAAV